MKFTVRAGDLRDAIDQVSKVVSKTPSQVVYSGIRLRVRDGALHVTGSDEGTTTITVTVPVTDPVGGDKVLLPKPLATYLSTLRATTLVTASAGASPELSVTADGGATYTFRLMEATYPNTTAPSDAEYTTDLTLLGAAVKAVKDSAGKSRIAQVVSTPAGVLLHATDGLRLARATLPNAHLGTFSGLLPIAVLERMVEAGVSTVAFDRSGRVFTGSTNTMRIIARLIDDAFPNVASILDDIPPHTVTIPTGDLTKSLARLAAVADRRPLVVSLNGDRLTLTTDSDSVGSGREQLELVNPSPAEITFGVNLDYFREALMAHTGPTATLGWSTAVRPICLSSEHDLPVVTVVMPVKLA